MDPFGDLTRKFNAGPDQRLGLRLALDLRLQRAAVRGLGKDKGAVVMLDPTTGEILAHGLHARLRRLGHRRSRHRDGDLQAPPGGR